MLGLGATRGAARSWRWRRGSSGVVVSGADAGDREAEQALEEEEEGRGPRDLVGICKNLKDSSVN
jgi:hypothetical protein